MPYGAEKALELLGLPESWAYVPAIIYLFILPFAAIYTLVWAFLVTIGIFPQANVNRLLALIITILTIPTGWFTNMVWALFSFMGAWGLAGVFGAALFAMAFRNIIEKWFKLEEIAREIWKAEELESEMEKIKFL